MCELFHSIKLDFVECGSLSIVIGIDHFLIFLFWFAADLSWLGL
jgi:hypothetical protein